MSDTTVSYGHAAAFFLLTFGIGLLPPVGVSVMGMKVLGVFLGPALRAGPSSASPGPA